MSLHEAVHGIPSRDALSDLFAVIDGKVLHAHTRMLRRAIRCIW